MTIGRHEDTERREGVVLTPEQAKSRRARNIAIGVAVALFVALFYFVTIVKLGGNVVPRAE
ncbi:MULTISPECIES: hypothetical protein [Methylosinus]|uniref:CoxF protein n=1 Tax=Methylosinus sporium TaxID=428 RepID=A0A2U1SR24_METSR|nr:MULTISPECIES: hypothetical protein [Methylosinus]MBU3888638.1 hypothetical protein [Methylosinus sp. KRF6]PWB94043.1 hypothetical protein C5689_09810 [Methylosinus sporium]TRL32444.1 hypothetical protein FM996_12050 [Methylosinus sporium]